MTDKPEWWVMVTVDNYIGDERLIVKLANTFVVFTSVNDSRTDLSRYIHADSVTDAIAMVMVEVPSFVGANNARVVAIPAAMREAEAVAAIHPEWRDVLDA